MKKLKITLSTIAEKANLSVASVSRVLNKPHLTSLETTQRVKKALQSLNMEININNIPLQEDSPNKKILLIDNQLIHQNLIHYAIENQFKILGYKLHSLKIYDNDINDISCLIHYIRLNAISGIVIINENNFLSQLKKYELGLPPIIVVNQFSRDFSCVFFDHLMIGFQATKHWIDKSQHKIALLMSHKHQASNKQFIEGYHQALKRANINFNPDYIINNCINYEHGKQAVLYLTKLIYPPTAIICCDHLCLNYQDKSTLGLESYHSHYEVVLGALHQLEIFVNNGGNKISLLFLSHSLNLPYRELLTISHIYKPLKLMGEQAANLLGSIINKKLTNLPHTHIMDTEHFLY